MREIVSVLGLPDKPVEVEVPKDIVCSSRALLESEMLIHLIEYFDDVALQCRLPFRSSIPASSHDQCTRRVDIHERP